MIKSYILFKYRPASAMQIETKAIGRCGHNSAPYYRPNIYINATDL